MPDPVPGNTPICAQRRASAGGSTLTLSPSFDSAGTGYAAVYRDGSESLNETVGRREWARFEVTDCAHDRDTRFV
jgi:hypothetical protein